MFQLKDALRVRNVIMEQSSIYLGQTAKLAIDGWSILTNDPVVRILITCTEILLKEKRRLSSFSRK